MKKEKILRKKIAKNITEVVDCYGKFAIDFFHYVESDLNEEEKPILQKFCTWCCNEGKVKTDGPVEILWQEWLDATEDKIKIVKTKTLRSTTAVEGTLVQVTGGKWYAVTRLIPPRSSWYTRACIATSTGRLSMEMSDMVFMKRHSGKPSVEEAIDLLMSILNGAEPIKELPTYN